VTVNAGTLTANLVPVLYDRRGENEREGDDHREGTGDDDGVGVRPSHGVLVGHMAKANPQWTNVDSGIEAMAILSGPDAYVSPSAYESKRQHGRVVPTWNYTAVHVYGSITWVHEPRRKLEIVTALTNRHEHQRTDPWQVTDAPAAYIEALLDAIIGFELTITRVDGKAKLSQNRSVADQSGVAADLARGPGEKRVAVASAMTANFRNG
jgi:transcriptional regulator